MNLILDGDRTRGEMDPRSAVECGMIVVWWSGAMRRCWKRSTLRKCAKSDGKKNLKVYDEYKRWWRWVYNTMVLWNFFLCRYREWLIWAYVCTRSLMWRNECARRGWCAIRNNTQLTHGQGTNALWKRFFDNIHNTHTFTRTHWHILYTHTYINSLINT